MRPKRKDSAALRRTWLRARRAEEQFGRALRGLARRVGELTVQMYNADDLMGSSARLRTLLRNYATVLRPWAQETAKRMVLDVRRRDEVFWADQSKLMARALTEEIKTAPIGLVVQERTREAADLIMSLPLEAAQRVEQLTIRAMTDSSRASEVAKEILKTGHVTKSRAELISVTEVSRTASLMVQTRAEYVGSEGYIWRTVGDSDVRDLHRKLDGKFIRWDSPPIAGSKGERAHAGAIYRCRCWPEPVIPQEKG